MTEAVDPGTQTTPRAVDILDHEHGDLVGASLRWKRYRRWIGPWPGHCEQCGALFGEGGTPGLNSGYSVVGGGPAGQDDYRWICAACYEIGRDEFSWTVLDTLGASVRPPDLLETVIGLAAGAASAGATESLPATACPSPLPRR